MHKIYSIMTRVIQHSLKLCDVSKIVSLKIFKVKKSVKFLLEIFSLRDTESHVIKLQMICTKIICIKMKPYPPSTGLTWELISSLCIYYFTGGFLTPWSSHISIIGNSGSSPFSCPKTNPFLLRIASSISICLAITRKIKGTRRESSGRFVT